ncbi:MAG TPA: squalene synthase HpnC [Terriglobia bacterium]|nr:squalene synthase HpnC [Terriglobia bacterium]
MPPLDDRIRECYAQCREISRKHYENFPTASRLVPRDKRDALAAIYAFARAADDFADEPGRERPLTPEERLRALEGWRTRLNECYASPLEQIHHPVFLALGDAARRYRLSLVNLDNLLRAFEQDVRMNRHPDFDSLLAYCTCSANPVGRLVLELFDYRDPELFQLSDCICTALQLANFWQDVAVDLARDRVYLPLDDLTRFGLTLDELQGFMASSAPVNDPRWMQLMEFEVARTAEIFEQGRRLPERVGRKLRRQLRITWLGGTTVLQRIRDVRYDVFRRRPALTKGDFLRLYLKSWRPLDSRAHGLRRREKAPSMRQPNGF